MTETVNSSKDFYYHHKLRKKSMVKGLVIFLQTYVQSSL